MGWKELGRVMMTPQTSALVKIATVAAAVLAGLLILLRATDQLGMFNIPTDAMAPFIRKGDTIIVQALTLHGRMPKRGDVITLSTEGIEALSLTARAPQIYIKRVVGLAGDRLQFKDGLLQINDKPVGGYFDVTNIPYVPLGLLSEGREYTVPADHLFVMGDNSAISFDSRYWGPLPIRNLRHAYWFHLVHGPEVKDKEAQP